MRSRTCGFSSAAGGRCRRCRKGRWSAEGIDRGRPSVHRCSAPWAAPAQPCPSPAISHRDGKGREGTRSGKGKESRGKDATWARRVPGAPAARPARYPLSPPRRAGATLFFPSFPAFLPRWEAQPAPPSSAVAPLVPFSLSYPAPPPLPPASPGAAFPVLPGGRGQVANALRDPALARDIPHPSLSPHGLFFFPLTPSRKSLNPESWGGAGAALAGAEGAGAGRAMPRSRGGPAGTARPAIKNK